jgi:hypothetical protein
MRIRLAIPDELDDHDRKDALDAALESVTRTVTGMVRAGTVPPAAGEIKAKRIRWEPEPPGDEHFDLPTTVLARGWGDCDDLAPYHAGSLRAGGVDPGARAIVRKSGPKRWHAIVQRSDGSIEDPSAHAGMHSVSGGMLGAEPPIIKPMSEEGRLCLAICPSQDRRHPLVWFARCDVPDKLEPWNWSTMAAHSSPVPALLHSVKTARAVAGESMDGEDYLRLGALNDLILGADPQEVADALGELLGDDQVVGEILGDAMHSVGFFGGLLKSLGKVATAPINLVSKIPGGQQLLKMGLPMAGMAFGGPFGGMAGKMIGNFLPGGKKLPGLDLLSSGLSMIPGMGGIPGMPMGIPGMPGGGGMPDLSKLFGGGGGGGGGMPDLSSLFGGGGGMPGFPELAKLVHQIPGASHAIERGMMARPWGDGGPAVMRF